MMLQFFFVLWSKEGVVVENQHNYLFYRRHLLLNVVLYFISMFTRVVFTFVKLVVFVRPPSAFISINQFARTQLTLIVVFVISLLVLKDPPTRIHISYSVMKTFLQFVYTTIGSYATEHYLFAVRNVFIKCLYIIASKSALICIKTPRNQ